jgi:enoyl-CoA hydratase/carnithine racemase
MSDLVSLSREGDLFILTLRNGDNRFTNKFIDALNSALDQVEQATNGQTGPAALVTVVDPSAKV